MKWQNEKGNLEKLIIIDNLSYESIGRIYGCSGSNIKKVAHRLGIVLPKRRNINPNETFNKGTAKVGICKNCGKEFVLYKGTNGIYCSTKCQNKYQQEEWIKKWKNGEENGLVGNYSISKHIRMYLFNKYNSKCEICGWGEVNKYTGKVPLQIHHIDGNCRNNKEENLQLLCPNCHSLTENFGSRNKDAAEGRSEYFVSENRRYKRSPISTMDSTVAS